MNLYAFTKSFGGQTAVTVPDLTLQAGTLYAVIGANGSGKSTFSRVIAGVLSPDSRRPVTEAGLRVGYLPQKSYGYRLSVLQNLLLVNQDRERAAQLLEAVQLSHLAGKPAHRLSGGETARMALARLFMGWYDLVILDEPTASMDMESTMLTEQLTRQYVSETGCALLLVTHSLQQARRLADHALYFHKGQLLEQGPAKTVLYEPQCHEAQQFLSFYGS